MKSQAKSCTFVAWPRYYIIGKGSNMILGKHPGLPMVLCKWEPAPSCSECRDRRWLCGLDHSLHHISYQLAAVCSLMFLQLHLPCSTMPPSRVYACWRAWKHRDAHDMRRHVRASAKHYLWRCLDVIQPHRSQECCLGLRSQPVAVHLQQTSLLLLELHFAPETAPETIG